MSYHVHNALKLKILLAIESITNDPAEVGMFPDLHTISKEIGVSKDKVSSALRWYSKFGYINKKKYNEPTNKCQYYYQLLDVGISTLSKLTIRLENHQTLNLRKDPTVLEGEYVKGKEFDEERERKKKNKVTEVLNKHNEVVLNLISTRSGLTPEEKEEFNKLNQEFAQMVQQTISI